MDAEDPVKSCWQIYQVAVLRFRGLQAPPCECGNDQGPYGFVRAAKYGDLLTGV